MWSAEILRWQSISFFAGELSHGSILITLAVVAFVLDATRLVTPTILHIRFWRLRWVLRRAERIAVRAYTATMSPLRTVHPMTSLLALSMDLMLFLLDLAAALALVTLVIRFLAFGLFLDILVAGNPFTLTATNAAS